MCSIIESTLREIKTEKPHMTWVYMRSDEAGCYHNNSLITAAREIGKRVGFEVSRCDFSEPQYGKDVCDRILCPMKTYIRRFIRVGRAKEISFDQLLLKGQGDTGIIVSEKFSPLHDARVYQRSDPVTESSEEENDWDDSNISMFECSEPGCVRSFQ